MVKLAAVIFDLDGVITDTAEYHYQAWKRLADEHGLPFDREMNERLRGVSRRESLQIILAGRQLDAARIERMMARKNDYYVAMLDQITPDHLLPGAVELLQELRTAGIKVALGSASKNARTVVERLNIGHLLDVVADGYSVERTKPAPDLFLEAAQMLAAPPGLCAVVEDAEAGVDAALAAGMWAIGLGPEERVGHAHARFDSLAGVSLASIQAALERAAWTVVEHSFDPAAQHHQETLFTTGNGYQCVRGALEEGYPGDMPAAFVHRLWDAIPLHFTELATIPRWWGIDLWVNGLRFRMDRGEVLGYRRQLDLQTGRLERRVLWRPEADGPKLELHFQRFVHMDHAHQAAQRLQLRVVEGEAELRVRTGFDMWVSSMMPGMPEEAPGMLHWRLLGQDQTHDDAWLHVETRATCDGLALAMSLQVACDAPCQHGLGDVDGQPTVERRTRLRAGQALTLDKFVAVVSSHEAMHPVPVAVDTARQAHSQGFEALAAANDAAWRRLWQCSDMVIEGDIEAQIAMRFNIFHLLIAVPRFTDRASIGAKTLSGFGYRHHVFWDTDIFMLPLFTYTQPDLARNMIMYRWHNLPGARAKAAANGYDGAQFPWESAASGHEVTPTWVPHFADPARLTRIWTGDIEIHITADIAYSVMQYWQATGDDAWMRDHGAEIVLDGARFWASAAQLEADGAYHYRNVIGPDEYHDRIDDNAYTNAMARWHLRTALALLTWLQGTYPHKHAELRAALELNQSQVQRWSDISERMYLHQDAQTGLIEQFAGFYELQQPDFAVLRDPRRTRSMQAILDIEPCAATQIIKQPDVLMLQFLLPDSFTDAQVQANYAYYDPRTDHEHGSSLGPSISAIMACRVGNTAAAYQHFMRAARADLLDVRRNADDGIHGASAGGLWQAAVLGFAGLRIDDQGWTLQPRLPEHWRRLAFRFYLRGEIHDVDIHADAIP